MWGWYDLDPDPGPKAVGYSLESAGYPGDRKGLQAHTGCRIYALTPDGSAMNDCATRAGSSGSPLFHRADAGPRGGCDPAGTWRGAADARCSSPIAVIAPIWPSPQREVLSHPEVRELLAADQEAYGADDPITRPASPIEAEPHRSVGARGAPGEALASEAAADLAPGPAPTGP